MSRERRWLMLLAPVSALCVFVAAAGVTQAQERLRFPFRYQGAGSEDQPVRYIMLRRNTERRTASNVLINAVNSIGLSLGAAQGGLLAPGNYYTSDFRPLSEPDVRSHNQNHPTKALPASGVIYGVQYSVAYRIEHGEFSIDVRAILGQKPAGPRPFRKYPGAYASEQFTGVLSRAIEGIFASAIFDRGDINNGHALVKRIAARKDAVSTYIWNKAGDGQGVLQKASRAAQLGDGDWAVMLEVLNRVLYDPGFYDSNRFAGLRPNQGLQSLINSRRPSDLGLMNRGLLQAWYPEAIADSPQFRHLHRVGG